MFLEILAIALSVNFSPEWVTDKTQVTTSSGVSFQNQTIDSNNSDIYISGNFGTSLSNYPLSIVPTFYDRESSHDTGTNNILYCTNISLDNSTLTFDIDTRNSNHLNLMYLPLVYVDHYGTISYIYDTSKTYLPCCVDSVVSYTFNNVTFDGTSYLAFKFIGLDGDTYERITRDNAVYYNIGFEDGYNNGYTNGYNEGELVGNADGYDTGYSNGYDVGKADGINSANQYTFLNLFGAVADTPVLMIRSLFDFDFFGVNLLSVVLSLFTALIVFYLWRKIV